MYKDVEKLNNKGQEFENIVENMFKKSGYEVYRDNSILYLNDFIAKRKGITYQVIVKYSLSNSYDSLQKQLECIHDKYYPLDNYETILVLSVVLKSNERYLIEKNNHNITIIDLPNLLYAVIDDDELKTQLLSILPNSVYDIVPLEHSLLHIYSKNRLYGESLISKINSCPTGRPSSTKFENICIEILKYLFSDSLTLWEKQKISNDNLYRFDLTCRVKDNKNCTFWSIVEEYLKSKYVVFEFKNYGKNTTQSQIYTTERYLYRKAFRNVAIMICANGVDDNSMWASKGCLRENGKLILPIDKKDVVKMIDMKTKQEEPSDYLQSKLDAMLLELEK